MSQIDRLSALLSRIQRNAAELAEARASGSHARDAAAMAQPAEAEHALEAAPAEHAVAEPEAAHAEPDVVHPHVLPTHPTQEDSDAEPAPSGRRLSERAGSEPASSTAASEPAPPQERDRTTAEVAGDDDLEAELAASETSGTWEEPPEAEAESYDDQMGPRTPPPESGPQVAPPPHGQLPELDAEAPMSTRGDQEPSIEQLGSTVDLEPATSSALEMETAEPASPSASPTTDEFEEELPSAERAGVYDESLRPPPSVQDDLEAVDRAHREREARLSVLPDVALSAAPDTIAVPPSDSPEAEAGVLLRSPLPANVVAATFEGQRRATSHTFLELLDDALRLG